MNIFLKVIFAVATLAGIWYWFDKRAAEQARAARIDQLAELVDFRNYSPASQESAVHGQFFKALAMIHRFSEGDSENGPRELVESAILKRVPLDSTGIMIADAFTAAIRDGEVMGLFDEGNLGMMESGHMPTVSHGSFAGEKARVDFYLSPAVVPELRNHPANFRLVPATVWALQRDRIDERVIEVAKRFRSARILKEGEWEKVEEKITAWKKLKAD